MVPLDGLEPSLLAEPDFESGVSTNFTTKALNPILKILILKTLKVGAGYQNRTDDRRLEICCFTIKLIPQKFNS